MKCVDCSVNALFKSYDDNYLLFVLLLDELLMYKSDSNRFLFNHSSVLNLAIDKLGWDFIGGWWLLSEQVGGSSGPESKREHQQCSYLCQLYE